MRKFKFNYRVSPQEEKIKRRAVIFGFLTVILGVSIVIWGIPLFINLVTFFGDVKSRKEKTEETDVVPPLVPRLSYIPEATNSAKLTISGFTEPKAKVIINFNDEQIDTQADDEGNFLVAKLLLEQGSNTLSLLAEDESGNQSEKGDFLEIIYDTQPPEITIEKPIDNEVFDKQTVDVIGKSELESRVLVDGHVVILGKEGGFIGKVTLKEGGNEIIIVAQDKAGNQTEKKIRVNYLP